MDYSSGAQSRITAEQEAARRKPTPEQGQVATTLAELSAACFAAGHVTSAFHQPDRLVVCTDCAARLGPGVPRRLPRDVDSPEFAERVAALDAEADSMDAEGLRAHYVSAMMNWSFCLDEVVALRDEIEELKK